MHHATTNAQAIKTAIESSVAYFIGIASEKHNRHFDIPKITYKTKGTCGGKAWGHEWRIDFNMGLIVDNMNEYLNQVVPHEIAHLIVHAIHGTEYKRTRGGMRRVSHGTRFYKVMREFGVDETRCHSMDTSKVKRATRKTKKFQYKCACGTLLEMGAIRHKKQQQMARYTHRCAVGHLGLEYIKQVA